VQASAPRAAACSTQLTRRMATKSSFGGAEALTTLTSVAFCYIVGDSIIVVAVTGGGVVAVVGVHHAPTNQNLLCKITHLCACSASSRCASSRWICLGAK